MKNMKMVLLILTVMLINIPTLEAGDRKTGKKSQKSETNISHKLKSMLTHSDFASENNIEGEYDILYSIDKNNKINIIEIKGENEKMKKDIYTQLSGKKLSLNDAGNHQRILKVSFRLN